MLLSLLACSNGVVTSAETFDWYTDEVACAGGAALWEPPVPLPMVAMGKIVRLADDATYATEYRVLGVGGVANGGEVVAYLPCDVGDTVTVTYAVRADPE